MSMSMFLFKTFIELSNNFILSGLKKQKCGICYTDCSVFFCDFSDSFKTTTITTYLWKENSQNFAIQFFCQLEEMWHFERSITSYCRKTSLVSKFKGFNFNACTVLNWWKIVSCSVVCYQFRYSFFFIEIHTWFYLIVPRK